MIRMKNLNVKIIALVIVLVNIITSCKKEEYSANIVIVNNTEFEVKSISIKGDRTNFLKSIEELSPLEEQTFDINWLAKSTGLFGSLDNSFVFLTIEYSIGTQKYNIQNEKDAKIDSFGTYYSEKKITNNSKIKIVIINKGYEILYLN